MRTKIFAFILIVFTLILPTIRGADFQSVFFEEIHRVWIGPNYWANPLQDWQVTGGRIECLQGSGKKPRTLHVLTHDFNKGTGDFSISVEIGSLDVGKNKSGRAGFILGARGEFNDWRDSAVHGKGFELGVDQGRLFIGKKKGSEVEVDALRLEVFGRFEGGGYEVTLTGSDLASGVELARMSAKQEKPEQFIGNIALLCGGRFWFRNWTISGAKVSEHPERTFGPILFAQHTLSRSILKITAQMPPMGDEDSKVVTLQIKNDEKWMTVGLERIDSMSRTATFKIFDWNSKVNHNYRLIYEMKNPDGRNENFYYKGIIRKDPVDKKTFKLAAFTGNCDKGFPHNPIVENVQKHNPDFLAFTGDQIYEQVGGFGVQRSPIDVATLDYLRKWYIYGWAHRELFRNRPVICLTDDHDVYHGNIWGEGGKAAKKGGSEKEQQDSGGYKMPSVWVNMVERTQTSHMPDPYDPTPVKQGIGVYYTDLVYGGISFALIEDRKFKSAPKALLPDADIVNGWAHNTDFDALNNANVSGAVLLGQRQLAFLRDWTRDWSGGVWMKALISQTIFNNVATLPEEAYNDTVVPTLNVVEPGGYPLNDMIVSDFDSNAWPQAGRDKAIREIRKAYTFHIAGDQHLGSTIQYGVEEWGDSGYAICVPSVANIWPRRWFPQDIGGNHVEGEPKYTGEFVDGFGNKMTVKAISNPHTYGVPPTKINDRAPGYGIIDFTRGTRKITMANWPRWVDVSKPGAKPYPGWPITIDQFDNFGRKAFAYLPTIRVEGIQDPVIKITDESTGELVYIVRAKGTTFKPKVFNEVGHTVEVGDPDTVGMKKSKNVKPEIGTNGNTIVFKF